MSSPSVALIDTGGANIASLRFALQRLDVREIVFTRDADEIRAASHVILPGVGAARDAMQRLQGSGLETFIPTLTQPVLGICLGMQLLFTASDEEDTLCLDVIPGRARRFTPAPERPVPQMGWNRLQIRRQHALLDGIADGDYVYFIHSYALPPSDATLATADYGGDFSAVVQRDNFCGTQFHPERSGQVGARILRNFLSL